MLILIVILSIGGAFIGSLLNFAIYSWAWFAPRKISPWAKLPQSSPVRTWADCIPIAGWLRLRRESKTFGKGFWIRPMIIEVSMAMATPLLFVWETQGGLFPSQVFGDDLWWTTILLFAVHFVLICLMVIATFIDFDEQTIPDQVTVSGTLFALVAMAVWPNARLPVTQIQLNGPALSFLDYASPHPLPAWNSSGWALGCALCFFVIWCWALLPKIITFRFGVMRAMQFCLASILRPKRKQGSKFDLRPRKVETLTKLIAVIFLLGIPAISIYWHFHSTTIFWTSLFSSLVGMAFGGAMVWSVRIIGTYCLNQEAMGFGDVTLMAMIGAFLGWQPALLIFLLAPLSAVVIVLIQYVVTRRHDVAFGPYLCLAAVIVLIGWKQIWNQWGRDTIFDLGSQLLVILLVGLILMGVMLLVWQKIKAALFRIES